MSFRLATTFTLLSALLAGCASVGQIGDQPTIWNRSISGGYSFSTFKYLSRKSPALVEVVGKAGNLSTEATSQAVLDGLLSSNQMFGLDAVTDKGLDHSDAVRLVFLMNPPKSLLASTVCETEDPSSIENSETTGKEQEVMVVYCLRQKARSSLRASYGEKSGLTETSVASLTKNLTAHILPPRNPERGRNCSTTITTDC